jgi:hypothetical protein
MFEAVLMKNTLRTFGVNFNIIGTIWILQNLSKQRMSQKKIQQP